MPPLTRWFIRTSFAYLILGLLVGVILGIQDIPGVNIQVANLTPTYFHLLAEGWITMLIIGVVFWMFPKYTLEQPRRNVGLAWASYILLNVGLLLRIASEPVAAASTTVSSWAILLTIAAALQWLGGMAFVINSWSRVKEK